jgi:aryl-alcohol dehydrogenase-like predicted oxidoreductase
LEKVKLGKLNLEVSALAMGSDLIGSRIDRETSFMLFDFFSEHGGTLIDTANFYSSWFPGCQGGESETTIGAWLKARGNRRQMQISSKVAFDYPNCAGGLTAAEILRECEKSLRRLETDYLDLYYAHRDDRQTPQAETMEAFERLQRAGKVRAVGASNLAVWRIAEANAISEAHGWSGHTVVQQRYTYLRPRHGADFGPQIFISEELKDYAGHHGIALLGYSVLLQGAYTRADREVPAQFAGPESDERLQALRSVASEIRRTPNQVIIAWMRQSRPAILPIIAGSRIEQVAENIAALEITLSDEQMERLNTAGNPVIRRAWLQPT